MNEFKTVLLVEDDPDIRELAALALSLTEKETITVDSGHAALESLEVNLPDVILLDVMMKGMDGIQTFKAIREKYEDPMIIFLTARVQSEEIDTYLALGAAGVISKPFDVMRLSTYIEDIWKKEKNQEIQNIRTLTSV